MYKKHNFICCPFWICAILPCKICQCVSCKATKHLWLHKKLAHCWMATISYVTLKCDHIKRSLLDKKSKNWLYSFRISIFPPLTWSLPKIWSTNYCYGVLWYNLNLKNGGVFFSKISSCDTPRMDHDLWGKEAWLFLSDLWTTKCYPLFLW